MLNFQFIQALYFRRKIAENGINESGFTIDFAQ